jgi:hypothetical protein
VKITVEALRDFARAVNAPYPQYDGMFDDWVLVRITGSWRSKGGSRFAPGDVVLASPEAALLPGHGEPTRRVFCTVTGSNCLVGVSLMREVA